MNPEVLQKVLSCPRLPSLPAVAARLVELVQNPGTTVDQVARTIANDQALAIKVLRTVNSSFYGLRRPCATISQAVVMLGMEAVKSLALGFTLVGTISKAGAGGAGFDYVDYWTRGLYTGIAARHLSRAARIGHEEECFLGGLLQDVGMIALHQALDQQYERVLMQADGDHRKLVNLEILHLETQHPDIGALLAKRWNLPDDLVMPIKYHERPTAAPAEFEAGIRAVALGNLAADVLMAKDAAGPLSRYEAKAEAWFGLDREGAEEILRQIAEEAGATARLFELRTGKPPDIDALLTGARERLAALGAGGSEK